MFPIVRLEKVLHHRKEFITISDSIEYKRCRVMSNRKGIILRDKVKGLSINTKRQQVCREGDFIVAEIDAKVGGYGFIPSELDGAIVSSHYYLFELDQSQILSEYLSFLIKTDIIQNQITSKGSTNYAAIRAKDVLAFSIPLPDINIQRQIIEFLNYTNDKYQLLLGQINSQLSNIQLLRQTILHEAVQGKLVPQDPTDEPAIELLKCIKAKQAKKSKTETYEPITDVPYEIPKGWMCFKLGGIVTNNGQKTPDKDFSYIDVSAIDNIIGKITSEVQILNANKAPSRARKIVKLGDIIYSTIRPYSLNIAIVEDEYIHEPIASTAFAVMKPVSGIVTKYLYYYLRSVPFIRYVESQMVGLAYPAINDEKLYNGIIAIPPTKEQKRIVAKVERLMQLCDELEAQVQQSKTDAEKLMQAVFREAFADNKAVIKRPSTKAKSPFREIQSMWYILAAKKNIPNANYFGEMGLAKETYIIDKVFDVNTGFNYVNWHWGPYDPAMRKILNAKNSYFVRKGDPNRGYIDIDQNKSATIEKYPFEDKEKITQAVTELHNIFSAYPSAERSNKIELLATVCKVIEDTKTTDFNTIRNAMTQWEIKDKKVPYNNKAEKFSEKETNACIKFIIDKGWDDKLLN